MLTKDQVITDKIYKNTESNYYVRIVHKTQLNLIFQYSSNLDDLIAGIAAEDCGTIAEFCEKFQIYEKPKIPTEVVLYRYLLQLSDGSYGYSNWNSLRWDSLKQKELKVIMEFEDRITVTSEKK